VESQRASGGKENNVDTSKNESETFVEQVEKKRKKIHKSKKHSKRRGLVSQDLEEENDQSR
jgi:hypothetical protein